MECKHTGALLYKYVFGGASFYVVDVLSLIKLARVHFCRRAEVRSLSLQDIIHPKGMSIIDLPGRITNPIKPISPPLVTLTDKVKWRIAFWIEGIEKPETKIRRFLGK